MLTVGDGWEGLSRFGPFFALDVVPGVPDGWSSVTTLADPGVLAGRVEATRAALATMAPGPGPGPEVPLRVAASVAQLGLTARLTAVALAAAVDGLPVPAPAALLYADRLGGPFPLAVLTEEVATGSVWPGALHTLVAPVVTATTDRYHLQDKIAWGNVASGLNGAAQLIMKAEPGTAPAVRRLVADALALEPLRGSLVSSADGTRRRTTCCLIYQLAGSDRSAVCGDCVLR